jgi:hypothetical protein
MLFTIALGALSLASDFVSQSGNSKESNDNGCFNSVRRLTL